MADDVTDTLQRALMAAQVAVNQINALTAALVQLGRDPRWLAGEPGAQPERFRAEVLRQRDPRWAGSHLGTFEAPASSTIGAYGCLVTSIAYLLNTVIRENKYTPVMVNDATTFINGNRVIYKSIEDAFGVVRFVGLIPTPRPVSAAQFAEIDRLLADGVPVIVKVDLSDTPGVQEHFVCIAEKIDDEYLIADPWHDDRGDDGAPALVPLLKHYPPAYAVHDAAHAIEAIVLFERKG